MTSRSIFAGMKVLDLASYIAGPTVATLLGDFGADVIKIEPPKGGDPYRNLPRTPGMPSCQDNFSWLFSSRNKRSLALDLKAPAGYEVLVRLIKETDVVIVNYPPRVRERLQIAYEDFAALNDRLIYASITGYGEKGEEANNPGFDSTAFWARTGLMDLVRSKNSPPAMAAPAMGDHPTALSLFSAILLALLERERTGKGSMASTSLIATGVWTNGILSQAMLCGAGTVSPPGPMNPINALNNIYQCSDERWFLLGIQNEEKSWPIITSLLKRLDLEQNEKFVDTPTRRKHAADLAAILREIFLSREMQSWVALFENSGITLSPVAVMEDIRDDKQMRASGAIIPYQTPDGSKLEVIDSPMWVSSLTKAPPGPAPELGEHTDEILREIGYDDAEIARLRTTGTAV